jgi:hypothetical protein
VPRREFDGAAGMGLFRVGEGQGGGHHADLGPQLPFRRGADRDRCIEFLMFRQNFPERGDSLRRVR